MLKTKIGNILIMINGKYYDYNPIELINKGKQFEVDKRYQIIIKNIETRNEENVIDCLIENEKSINLNACSESGEKLALISFMVNMFKLSIGVEGDIPGITYVYLSDRLRISIPKAVEVKELKIFVAWIEMQDANKEEIYTWFAADPTLGV